MEDTTKNFDSTNSYQYYKYEVRIQPDINKILTSFPNVKQDQNTIILTRKQYETNRKVDSLIINFK